MKFSAIFGLALLMAAQCADANATAENTPAENQIRAALGHWVDAANRGDYKAMFEVWAPDLVGWSPDGSDDTYQHEAELAKRPPRPPQKTYQLTINEVIVDGSLAVVRDTWTQTTKRASEPDEVVTFRGYEVWRRQPDKTWKISRWIDGPVSSSADSGEAGPAFRFMQGQ